MNKHNQKKHKQLLFFATVLVCPSTLQAAGPAVGIRALGERT